MFYLLGAKCVGKNVSKTVRQIVSGGLGYSVHLDGDHREQSEEVLDAVGSPHNQALAFHGDDFNLGQRSRPHSKCQYVALARLFG